MDFNNYQSEPCEIEVSNGQIVVTSVDGVATILPCSHQQWLPTAQAIIKLLPEHKCFDFAYYKVKCCADRSSDQLGLYFKTITDRQTASTFFNVYARSQRNTKKHKAGSGRPKGQFNPPKHGSFTALWERLGFCFPRSYSEFHRVMRQLHGKLFIGAVTESAVGLRIDKNSLEPLNLTHHQLLDLGFKVPQLNVEFKVDNRGENEGGYRGKLFGEENTVKPETVKPTANFKYMGNEVHIKSNHQSSTSKAIPIKKPNDWVNDFVNDEG